MRKIVDAFDNEWTNELLEEIYETLDEIAVKEWGYDIYPNQIEIISSEGMLEAYATVGLPVMYTHWSFGKRYLSQSREYKAGLMGLAYEVVINSNPCISYLMESNTLTMQTLVMAHACFGHNCFANDTELLTINGWKSKEDVHEGDPIATLNRQTRMIEYHPVQKKFEYDYNGKMCHFKNSSADHLVTPNHKMVYWSEALQKIKECDASEWTATGTFELVSGKLDIPRSDGLYTDDELRLLVWCITDGNLSYEPNGYWRFHLKKQRKINRLSFLLDDLGLDYKCRPTKDDTVKFCVHLSNKFYKQLRDDFYLSSEQFNVFIREWLQTDGSFQTKVSEHHEDSGSLFTSKKSHVDKIQELAAICGAKSSYRMDDNGVYTINIRLNKEIVQLSNSPLTDMVDYEGKVWCVSVQNHTVISRRNGRVLITGNSFFKNNYLFKQWTQPDWIIDYLGYAKRYIIKCEEKYGIDAVERLLDAVHTLEAYSVDKYNRVRKSKTQLEEDLRLRLEWEDSQFDVLVNPFRERKVIPDEKFMIEPTENLLYFLEKYAPNLDDWQREIVRIARKVGQYFYPQRQLQLMNEGFATATHSEMTHELWNRGLVDDRFMLEFMTKHSAVLGQQSAAPGSPLKILSPYKFGYEMYMDIKRRCQNPTKEDEYWFPDQINRPFREVWFEAVAGYKDESFITQYLSPEVVRKLKLMSILDSDKDTYNYKVSGISDDESFEHMRKYLSRQYDFGSQMPQISVYDVVWSGDRSLKLRHEMQGRRPLDDVETKKVLRQIHSIWQFPVTLESFDGTERKVTHSWP